MSPSCPSTPALIACILSCLESDPSPPPEPLSTLCPTLAGSQPHLLYDGSCFFIDWTPRTWFCFPAPRNTGRLGDWHLKGERHGDVLRLRHHARL